MRYEDFACCVHHMVQQKMGPEISVELRRVTKNNGVKMDGLSIIEEGQKISPVIYLDDYYEIVKNGGSLPEIADEIIKVYDRSKVSVPIDPDFYTDFERVRERVVCKLINIEKNRQLLEKVPYIPYLDLAVVFYYMMENEEIGNGTILIYNSHLVMWKIKKEQLFDIARRNTLKMLPYEFKGMGEILEEAAEMDEEQALPMYVLSNQDRNLGAVNILYDSILSKIAEELDDDFFILPSSIHECIIVPADIRAGSEELQEMVREINKTQLLPEDVLSDQVYFYERKNHRLGL